MEFMHPDGSLLEGSLASTLGKAMVTAITDFMDEGSSDSNDSNDSSNQDRKAGHESSQAPPSLFLLASNNNRSNNNSKSNSSTTNKSSRNPQRSRARQLYQLGGTCLEETAASSLATIVQCATMRTDNTSDHHRGTLPASPLPLPSSASKSTSTSTSTSKSLLARPVSAAVVSPCCSQDEEGDRDQEEECGTPDGNASRDHNESRSQSPSQSPQRINFYHEREDERERGDDDPNSSLESHSHSHSNSEPSPVRHLPPPRTSPSSYQDPFNSILDDDRKATDSPGRRKIHRPRSKRRMFGSKVTSKFFCGGSGSTYEPEDEIRIPSCPLSSPSPSSPSSPSALSWCGGIPSILAYGGDGGESPRPHLPKQPCRDPFCGYLADLSPQRQYAFDEDDEDDDDDVHVTDGYHKGAPRHSTSVGSSTIPALVEDDESLSSSSEDCKHDHDANHHHQHQHQHHHHCNQNHHHHRYSLVSTMDSLKSSLRKGSKSYDSTDDECTLESASVTTGTSSSVQSFMMVDQPHGVPSASVLLANALRSASIVTEHYQQRQQQQQQYQQYQKHQQLRYQHPKQHSLSLHEWMAPPALPSSESAESRTFSPEYALSKTLMRSLQKHLPLTKKGDSFWLHYSLIRDGASLDRLLDKVHTAAGSGAYSVLAVETVEGEVFGAFCTQPWKRSHKRWYGGGQGFLWTTSGTKSGKNNNNNNNKRNKLQVFGSSFRNSYYQLCDQNRLVVGAGGDSGFGLALEADLSTGTSHPCATFDSPSLSGLHADGSPFGVRNVEVWTLTPCLSRVEAHGRTRVHRSEKNESNHKNNKSNNNNKSNKSAAQPPGADATPGAFTDKENAVPPSLSNPSTTTRPRNKALRR